MAQVKRVRRDVSGIILLDKPRGFTSNAALQKVRWLLNAEKAGHTGSLDPLATGVLPLCFGEATKFSQYLLDADKAYETVMQLGVTTTTADAEGEVLERKPVAVTREQLEALFAGRLYIELARRNDATEMAAEKALMRDKVNSYGKTWHVWHTGAFGIPGDALPMGEPRLAWSFNRDGEIIPGLPR